MAIYTLDFLNKNKFRRFPFRAETTLTTVDGKILSNELIVGMSITTNITRNNLYISQIFVKDQLINIVLSYTSDGDSFSLGRFVGTITEDYSVLYLEQFERFVNGILILGSTEEIRRMQGGYFFNPESTRLEDSTIFYYTPPAVKSVVNKNIDLRGRVEFGTLTNLVKSREDRNIKLSTTAGAKVASLADKSSYFRNCPTPLIYSINEAVPFKDENNDYPILDGNIYMIGIKPIVFYGEFGMPGEEVNTGGTILAETIDINNNPLTLDTLCTARNKVLPPINPVYLNNIPDEASQSPTFIGKNNYYTKSYFTPVNFIKVIEPEFLSWPQFFKNFTHFVINKPSQTQENIIVIPQNKTGTIKRIVLRNSPRGDNSTGSTVNVSFSKNNSSFSDYFELSANRAITIDKFEVPFAQGDIFSVNLNQVQGDPYTLQVILFYR